jgi:carbon-monoxide dehydrogenase large subunit
MVVAETRAAAMDGAELVEITYEELPHVADAAAALEPGAPRVWNELESNLLVESFFGDEAATEAAFSGAAHVVEAEFHIGRVTAVPLEPRSALAVPDARTGRIELYAGSGGAVRQKREIAQVLSVEPERLRLHSYDVGGNFGARNRVYVEFPLVAWAARRLGRPVKFTATRSEAFLSDYQGRDLRTKVALALDEDGRFLALRADNLSNAGAYCVSLSPLAKGSALITGSYAIPTARLRARSAFTNTMPTQAYRSSGRPEVTFAIERLIELAAKRLKLDPLELRRRNLVPAEAMPYRNAVGARYDSGTYAANMDKVLAFADWDGFEARRREAEARGRLLGRGFATYVESSIGTPKERAEITAFGDGGIEVVIGTQPSGQGHETSFAQVVADLLGAEVENVRMVMGDTDVVTVGGGSHSGRSMRHAGTVMALAAAALMTKAKAWMADRFNAELDDVRHEDGRFLVAGSNHVMTLAEIAAAIEARTPEAPLRVVTDNEMHDPVFPNGAAVCEVEIDPETGALELTRYACIDDVGRCINPLIVHGQTHGGIAQVVGQAIWEAVVVKPGSGQPLAGSFMDYAMPRADGLPSFETEIAEVHSPTNPLGIKAGGEGGTTPALAVIVNAVVDALKPFGVEHVDMPVTPLRVWETIQAARNRNAARNDNAD